MDYLVRQARLFLALLLLTILASLPVKVLAQNQMPDPLSAEDADAIHAVINKYFHTFSAGDFEEFTSVFVVPYYLPGTPLFESTDQIVELYQGIREQILANNPDYQTTLAARVKILPLWFGGVIAQVHWQRLTAEHELIVEAGEAMFIRKEDDAWKIAALLPMDLREWDKGYEFTSSAALPETTE